MYGGVGQRLAGARQDRLPLQRSRFRTSALADWNCVREVRIRTLARHLPTDLRFRGRADHRTACGHVSEASIRPTASCFSTGHRPLQHSASAAQGMASARFSRSHEKISYALVDGPAYDSNLENASPHAALHSGRRTAAGNLGRLGRPLQRHAAWPMGRPDRAGRWRVLARDGHRSVRSDSGIGRIEQHVHSRRRSTWWFPSRRSSPATTTAMARSTPPTTRCGATRSARKSSQGTGADGDGERHESAGRL